MSKMRKPRIRRNGNGLYTISGLDRATVRTMLSLILNNNTFQAGKWHSPEIKHMAWAVQELNEALESEDEYVLPAVSFRKLVRMRRLYDELMANYLHEKDLYQLGRIIAKTGHNRGHLP